VSAWLAAVLDLRDLHAAWPVTDEPFRLATAQSWILMEGDLPEVQAEDRNGLAVSLAAPEPTLSLWPLFAGWRVERWRQVLPPYVVDPRRRGVIPIPAPVSLDLEAVMIGESGNSFQATELVEVHRYLVRHTADGARLAGIGGVLPIPGWPPSETDRMPT
jgi:hypothetical protein